MLTISDALRCSIRIRLLHGDVQETVLQFCFQTFRGHSDGVAVFAYSLHV
jgi:hypothetical protein